MGPPARGGRACRRSRLAALTTQRMLARLRSPRRVAGFDDVQLGPSLISQDVEQADEFVKTTLGDLATASPELRHAVLTYIQAQCNTTRAAGRLYTHRNTLLRQLDRADQLLRSRSRTTPSRSPSPSTCSSGVAATEDRIGRGRARPHRHYAHSTAYCVLRSGMVGSRRTTRQGPVREPEGVPESGTTRPLPWLFPFGHRVVGLVRTSPSSVTSGGNVDDASPTDRADRRLLARATLVAAVGITRHHSGTDPTPRGPYVALGDSCTAGPRIPTRTRTAGCDRSDHDYPALVAERLGLRPPTSAT